MIKTSQPALHGVQHLPDGSDPIPGFPAVPLGDTVLDLIAALPGLDAFWKLNESLGTVAHDSSGNGHDLSVQGVNYTPTAPVWAQLAGPPGEQTAHFGTGADGSRVANSGGTPMTAFTNNFSAGIWINVHATVGSTEEILGQGYPLHGSNNGWGLLIVSSKFNIMANGVAYAANSTLSVDTWYFLALVRDAGNWKLYVNGLLQTATGSTAPGSGYGGNTWIGSDDFIAGGTSGSHTSWLHDAYLSYGFIANSVISGTELLAIYDAGVTSGLLAAGLVWTTNGAGGASWELPTVEVDY